MLIVIIGILIWGLGRSIFKIIKDWNNLHAFNFEMIVVGVFLVGLIIFFGNHYLENRAFNNNLKAVYQYFGPEKVSSISVKSDGTLYQANVNEKVFNIKVDKGEVEYAKEALK